MNLTHKFPTFETPTFCKAYQNFKENGWEKPITPEMPKLSEAYTNFTKNKLYFPTFKEYRTEFNPPQLKYDTKTDPYNLV